MIKKNYPVNIDYYDRGTAEQKYGFRIYQGGVVPVKSVRIVSIEDKDIEACGGTHVKKTGDIQLIKITKTKRIQDGVVRVEFVSGPNAYSYVKQQKEESKRKAEEAREQETKEMKRNEMKSIARTIVSTVVNDFSQVPIGNQEKVGEFYVCNTESGKFVSNTTSNYDESFHKEFGEKLTAQDPSISYCTSFDDGQNARVYVINGKNIPNSKNAGKMADAAASKIGGKGGGSEKVGNGKGPDKSKKEEAVKEAERMFLE